jgi:uncharacterized protein (DUF305 family)
VTRTGRIGLAVAGAFTAIVVVAVVVAALAGGGDGDGDSGGDAPDRARTVQPGAPGEDSRELTDDEADDLESPGHTPADTAFMQHMIVHHRQALAMTALVADRSDRDDLPVLALRITETQETEIDQMSGWLTERDEEVPADAEDGTDGGHGEHAGMPGMATAAQLDDLADARGTAFDRQFLELMIAHHQGALTMVSELREDGGGVEPAADRFARDAESDQSIEITRMQELLENL